MTVQDAGGHPTKSEVIANELRAEILAGTHPAGSPLPSTSQLRRRFSVSAMTVRTGVDILQREGLVRGRQGAGVFVSDRPEATRVAYVQDSTVAGTRHIFLRFVRRGEATPAETIATEAHVDLGEGGEVIGVTFTLPTVGPEAGP